MLGLSVLVAAVLLRQVGYLALPKGVGGQVQLAAAMRERNRLLKHHMPALEDSVSRAQRLEDTAALAGEVGQLMQARWARLDLTSSVPDEPVRSWAWGSQRHRPADCTMSFPLAGAAGILGQLTLAWDDEQAVDEGLIQNIERSCRALARQLDHTVPESNLESLAHHAAARRTQGTS